MATNCSRNDCSQICESCVCVVGPTMRSLTRAADLAAAVPPRYPIRQYPDLAHPTESQYGLRAWSHVWAYTQQRNAIGALPRHMERIVRLRAQWRTIGAGGYSEGISDDLHKVWPRLMEPNEP